MRSPVPDSSARKGQFRRRSSLAIAAAACGLALGLLAPGHALAQSFPDKPIKLVVPYAAGSATDTLARQLGPRLAQVLGTAVVVDNKPGGAAIIGTQSVAQAPADGYTLLLGTGGTHAVNKYLFKDLPYDPEASFTPVARLTVQANVLVVNGNSPFRTLPDLVAHAKANPGKLSFASIGIGSTVHLTGEMLNSEAKIKVVHVPYKSAGQALSGLLAGDVAMMFYPYGLVAPHIQSGALRALATTGATRATFLKSVPTMVELGYPDFVLTGWNGIYGPANLPAPVVGTLQRAVQRVLAEPALQQALAQGGSDQYFAGPEEFAKFTRSEIVRFKKIVEDSGAKAD